MPQLRLLVTLALAAAALGVVPRATAQSTGLPIAPGDIVITEFFEDLLRIDPATGVRTPLDPGDFNPTNIIAFDASRRLLAIDKDRRLVRFDPVNLTVTPVTTTLFPLSDDIAVEPSGMILVANDFDIVRVNPATGAMTTLVNHEQVNGGFFNPFGVAVTTTGRIFVSEFFQDLWEINPTTGAAVQVPRSRDIILRNPLEVRSDGSLISREFDTGNFLKINPATGAVTNFATDVPTFVNGIALEADDDLLVASDIGVFRYNAASGAKTTLTPDSTFFTPGGIAVAPSANGPNFAADFDNDGDVDHTDLTKWTANFGLKSGATKAQGNADGDADVDGADFLAWQREVGASAIASAVRAVPEPASFLLFAVAAFAAGASRRIA